MDSVSDVMKSKTNTPCLPHDCAEAVKQIYLKFMKKF